MTNFRAAIFASPSVVAIASKTHLRSVSFTQATRWAAYHHFRAAIGKIGRDVNPQCVLLVISTCYSDFDPGVACWVDPRYTVSEVLLKQGFLISKACLLRCWPGHSVKTSPCCLTWGSFENIEVYNIFQSERWLFLRNRRLRKQVQLKINFWEMFVTFKWEARTFRFHDLQLR